MSGKAWLVAYDIANPARLRKVHRIVRRVGVPVQYSAFSVQLSDAGVDELIQELRCVVHPTQDDVRAYHIPKHCRVWTVGCEPAEGVTLDAEVAMRFLTDTIASTEVLAE